MITEKKKRGRPKKKVEAEKKETPVVLPIRYVGTVALKPDDLRFADIPIGSFVYDTKTNEATVETHLGPAAWKEFETIFNVGIYKIKDLKTETEIKLVKAEDPEKWIQYIEEANFITTRGIYHIVEVNKIYEAA